MPTKTPLGLRTTIYRVPDLNQAKIWYAKAFSAQPYFDEPLPWGNVIGVIYNPEFKG